MTIPCLTDRVRGMVTDVPGQKRDKKNGLWDRGMAIDILVKNNLEKNPGKNPVRETDVWSLPDRVKNLNTGVRRP